MKPALYNLWIVFIPAYALIWCVMIIVNSRRGRPIEDPDLMEQRRKEQMLLGFFPHIVVSIFSIFTPIIFSINFIPGILIFLTGFVICLIALFSFSDSSIDLNTKGIYSISRNPMYLGMYVMALGLCIIAFAYSFAAILFIIVSALWVLSTHCIVIREEKFLSEKYGEMYNAYKENTRRYLSLRRHKRNKQ